MVTGRVFHADAPSLGAGSAVTTIVGGDIENQGVSSQTTNAYGLRIAAQSGASGINMPLHVVSGIVGIGATSNAGMTTGITIRQGASDDQVLAFGSSDVAHGMTDHAETDLFGTITKAQGTSGGLTITGLKDADGAAGYALYLKGFLGEAADTTHDATGVGAVIIEGAVKSGTGVTSVGANGNVLVVQNAGSTKFIVDAEGDLFADGSDVTVYDEYDDAALLRTYELARVNAKRAGGYLLAKGDEFIKYNEQTLVDLGILGAPLREGGLTNITRLQKLQSGAIWQGAENVRALRELVASLVDAIKTAPSLAALKRHPALAGG